MIRKILKAIATSALTVLLIWGIGLLWFAGHVAASKPPEDIVKTDSIVVLTGGKDRVNTGLDLLHEKHAGKLFISGVNKQVQVQELIALWKPDIKKPPCCITLGYEATDTQTNALETAQWVSANNIETIRLVTSTDHMPRALLELKHILPSVPVIRHPVKADDFRVRSGIFWQRIFIEYNKTLLTWLKLHMRKNMHQPEDKSAL